MGVLECGAMAARGYFDVFDRAAAVLTDIEGMLPPYEYHAPTPMTPDTMAHYFDPYAFERLALERARDLLTEACQIAQNVLAGME